MGYLHFFDDWQLISYQNLQRKQGKPKFVPEATLEDELTEGTWNFPLVAFDRQLGKYVGLYGGAATLPNLLDIKIPTGVDRRLIPRTQVLCYAESDDGIHWTRPDLRGKTKFDGPVFAPNQVFGLEQGLDGGPPCYDPYDPDPQRRYKYLINYKPPGRKQPIRALVVSPNGINWRIAYRFECQKGTDTPTSVFYHPEKQVYVFNVRRYGGDRRIFFFETKDWQTFTEPELIMHPDSMDPPLVGFYGMPVVRYENLFLGLLWQIYCDPATNALPNGAIDCKLVYSYDGNHFNRTFREPFIERNELGEHGGGCIYVSSMLVTQDHQIRFYSGGSKAEHFQNQTLKDAALMLHTLRLDGFVYLATPSGKGRLRTRPLYITGDDLRINARSPYGGIRVRILDENAREIPGYGFDECHALQGDELFWTPTWSGGKTIGGVKSYKRRQLEIEITTGEIYAIRGDFQRVECLWDKDEPHSGLGRSAD